MTMQEVKSGFAAAKESAEIVKREQDRLAALDRKYKELFDMQKIAFLLEYIELRAMHQLEKTGAASVSLRDYRFDFFSTKTWPDRRRYSYADVFMELLEADTKAVNHFNKWLKQNELKLSVREEDDGFGMTSWLVVNFS